MKCFPLAAFPSQSHPTVRLLIAKEDSRQMEYIMYTESRVASGSFFLSPEKNLVNDVYIWLSGFSYKTICISEYTSTYEASSSNVGYKGLLIGSSYLKINVSPH